MTRILSPTSCILARRYALLLASALVVSLPGCGGDSDRVVYVPGSAFQEALFIAAQRGPVIRAGVGEPVILSAQRRSGPWRAVRAAEVPEGGCFLESPPLELEVEVADNITWTVTPEGAATFNTGIRDDRRRVVTFDAPGSYRVTATSASWCGEPFGADTLEVEIRP